MVFVWFCYAFSLYLITSAHVCSCEGCSGTGKLKYLQTLSVYISPLFRLRLKLRPSSEAGSSEGPPEPAATQVKTDDAFRRSTSIIKSNIFNFVQAAAPKWGMTCKRR